MVAQADCGHWFETRDLEIDLGDEVDCPVCADTEKKVKLARVEELRAIVQTLDKMPRNRIESVVKHLTARLAELEKV